MIHWHQGEVTTAKKEIAEAARRLSQLTRSGRLGDRWHEYGRVAVIRAEAERLIFGHEVSPQINSVSLRSARQSWEPVDRHLLEGDRLVELKKWPEARNEYLAATREPVFEWESARLANWALPSRVGMALLLAKDRTNHAEFCRQLFSRLEEYPSLDEAYTSLLIYLSTENHDLDDLLPKALQWSRALEQEPDGSSEEIALVRAMVAFRNGRFQEAIDMSKVAKRSASLAIRAGTQIYRAMALGKSGRPELGRKELAEAEAVLGEHLESMRGGVWWYFAMCRMACEEAHLVLGEQLRN